MKDFFTSTKKATNLELVVRFLSKDLKDPTEYLQAIIAVGDTRSGRPHGDRPPALRTSGLNETVGDQGGFWPR